jgi:hypothetical protein
MKLAAIITIAAMAAANAQGKSDTGRPVTVYLNAGFPLTVLGQAERLACDMFAVIGVTLKWRSVNPLPSEANAIAIDVVWSAPAAFKPAALALTFPGEGVHVRIFWGRIAAYHSAPKVLAHVMVHEITHILQGVAQHSDEGIMKARWTGHDLDTMVMTPLQFTPADVDKIYRGMEARGGHQ